MMDRMTLREFIAAYNAGEVTGSDGWYDWFCKNTSLFGKTKRMMPMVKRIANSKKFDQDKVYVWFKNNCPLYGKLYDDFRIADMETGNTLYTIVPSSGYYADHFGEACVYGEGQWDNPLASGTKQDIYEFFGV